MLFVSDRGRTQLGSVGWGCCLILLALCLIQNTAFAEEPSAERDGGPLGVGFIIGDLNGLTLKYWPNETHVFQARMGSVSTANGSLNSFGISVTYEYHFRPIQVEDNLYSLPFYLGLGGRFNAASTSTTYVDGGVVGVMGMSVLVPGLPAELFFEVRPVFALYNTAVGTNPAFSPAFGVEGGLGMHYYY